MIADSYRKEFEDCFTRLGFTYDTYTRTATEHHHKIVQEIFLELLEKELNYKKEIEQTYCEYCRKFLPASYVEGICPVCKELSRGDQCDSCSTILEPLDLLERKCKICGIEPTTRFTEHFYFSLSSFQNVLDNYTQEAAKRTFGGKMPFLLQNVTQRRVCKIEQFQGICLLE